MGALTQVLEIIFEMQRKSNNKKITIKEKAFQLTKCVLFFCFGPPLTLKTNNFLNFCSF